jgi:hypothetical protein
VSAQAVGSGVAYQKINLYRKKILNFYIKKDFWHSISKHRAEYHLNHNIIAII